jgi:anionic cell wall polymer biosynthesis LytR-Cps2A-Psr (LCP) family protein
VSPRSVGPRQARRAQLRRRRRTQGAVALFGGIAVCAVIILGAAWIGNEIRPETPAPTPQPSTSPAVEQDTLLLVRETREDGPAAGTTLLVSTPDENEGMILFIPAGTLVDIPGFGLDRLGLAYQYGGSALVEASVENVLGIDIDHVAAASSSSLAALLARTGGFELTLEERLVERADDGTAEVRFEPGEQFLDGERLAEYWSFRQSGESELDSFPRQQRVWSQLLRAATDPEVIEAMVADGATPLNTTADTEFLTSLLSSLAAAQDGDRLQFDLLPVSPFGGEDASGGITYRPTPAGIERLAAGPLAGSVPTGGGTAAIRVQVLNGVGTPGIGQEVDERLEGTGVRIVLTDNARSFDFAETRILVYREDQRSLDAARLVQERLGVGTIQISRQPQSVVDLTIVVGADFEEEQGPSEE